MSTLQTNTTEFSFAVMCAAEAQLWTTRGKHCIAVNDIEQAIVSLRKACTSLELIQALQINHKKEQADGPTKI
jgi:hypothetical protein